MGNWQRWTRGRLLAVGCALLLAATGCTGDDGAPDNPFTDPGSFGVGSGKRGDDGSNGSDPYDDPFVGYYQVDQALENLDGCEADRADSIEPDGSHLLVLYEMTDDFGPAYVAYWCDSDSEDDCDETSAFVFPDVEVADAEQLPEADDRAQGDLGILFEDTHWDAQEWACYAILEETDLAFDDESLEIGLFEHSVQASDIQSENECRDVDRVHRNYGEDDFACSAAYFFEADKVASYEESRD